MQELTLFQLMDAKLAYTTQRQAVLSQNIANANTPGYKSMDVKAPDFKAILMHEASATSAGLAMTRGNHMNSQGLTARQAGPEATVSYEIAPDNNAVDLEEQMIKAGKNSTDANVLIGLYTKQLALLRLAVGASNR